MECFESANFLVFAHLTFNETSGQGTLLKLTFYPKLFWSPNSYRDVTQFWGWQFDISVTFFDLNQTLKSGKYQDVASCSPTQKINLESRNNVTMNRQTYYCVPVPAENQWVKEISLWFYMSIIGSLFGFL